MLEGKAMVKETDMSTKMQIHAMASASQALDLYDVYDCISIAAHIKKVPHFFLSLIWGVGLKNIYIIQDSTIICMIHTLALLILFLIN